MEKSYILNCPHCKEFVQIFKKDIKCAIFRHGIYKQNMKQMNPHAKKKVCDELKRRDLIYGCGKPFKLIFENDEVNTVICDYI
jgi:hypothetical protein|tara:strand:- start:124 stop:372 length:249 start_codon:yes stop_codon:yes gene_type:complete